MRKNNVILSGKKKVRNITTKIILYEKNKWILDISKNISFFQSNANIYKNNNIYVSIKNTIVYVKVSWILLVSAKNKKNIAIYKKNIGSRTESSREKEIFGKENSEIFLSFLEKKIGEKYKIKNVKSNKKIHSRI